MFSTLCSLSHALVNYSRFLPMRVIDVNLLITLFLPCFVSRMGSELSHRALHSCTSHSRLQLRAPRVWSGHGTGLAPVCTPAHCVQLSTAQSGAAAGSRRKVREIENLDERATRAFRLRKQVGAVRWKRERRTGAAYAQGRRRHRLHDDDLSDPEYEYTHLTS